MANKPVFYLLFFSAIILLLILLMQPMEIIHFHGDIDVLFPRGIIALKERNLLFLIQILMLFVIVPVYILTFVFSWRYRAGNKSATYDPDLIDHRGAEIVWWGVPLILTLAIGFITWIKTEELDPFKPIASDKPAKIVQVVALQWKWLFIYPEEKIATINYFQIPVDTPIHFVITADAPMNSFWLPQLGGQIYAMPNMQTELHLIADAVGDYRGSSANISGEGFAQMHFIAHAAEQKDYETWVDSVRNSSDALNFERYQELAKPSLDNPVELFQLADNNLFKQIMMKYMQPMGEK